MEITSIELKNNGGRRHLIINASEENSNKVSNIKVVHLNLNETDWYFKVTSVSVIGTPNGVLTTILAEDYGYWSKFERKINSVDDFGAFIGANVDVVTDKDTLETLRVESTYC